MRQIIFPNVFYYDINPEKINKETDIVLYGSNVSGINIEEVSQTAANLEQSTRIKNKDLRVYLDGIYLFKKGRGKE